MSTTSPRPPATPRTSAPRPTPQPGSNRPAFDDTVLRLRRSIDGGAREAAREVRPVPKGYGGLDGAVNRGLDRFVAAASRNRHLSDKEREDLRMVGVWLGGVAVALVVHAVWWALG